MEDDYGQRLKVFLDKHIPIHIKTNSDEWINGFVNEVGSTFAIISEFKKGLVLVFFKDIYFLETYTKVEK